MNITRYFSVYELHDLYNMWLRENKISNSDMFDRYNLKGTFIQWLENKIRNKKIKRKQLNIREQHERYKKGYQIVMEIFNHAPNDIRVNVHRKLKELEL